MALPLTAGVGGASSVGVPGAAGVSWLSRLKGFLPSPAEGVVLGMKLLMDQPWMQTNQRTGRTPQDYRVNYPNYPGDPLMDILSNPLINYQRLLPRAPYMKGTLMNQGIDPRQLMANQPRRVGSYGRPSPSYMGMSGIPGKASYPQSFQPFTPSFIFNTPQDRNLAFKPGPTFRMDPGGFGVQDLVSMLSGGNIPETPPIRDPIPGISF